MQRAIELIAEERIREAYERGEFSKLPGFGRPLEIDDTASDPYWWVREKLKAENLRVDRIAAESFVAPVKDA
jgi:hypothetical protein